jgi:hypothetical protein
MGAGTSCGKEVHAYCQPDARYRNAISVQYLCGQGFVWLTGRPAQSYLFEHGRPQWRRTDLKFVALVTRQITILILEPKL